jgi:hypothetical protein
MNISQVFFIIVTSLICLILLFLSVLEAGMYSGLAFFSGILFVKIIEVIKYE